MVDGSSPHRDARQGGGEATGGSRREPHHLRRAIVRDLRGPDSYLPILLLSVGVMLSFPLAGLSQLLFGFVTLPMTLGIVHLAFRRMPVPTRTKHIVLALCIVGTLAAITASVADEAGATAGRLPTVVSSMAFGLLLVLTLPAITARALQHRRVTLNTLAAALSAYLIIGLFFSTFYRFLDAIGGGGFFAQTTHPNYGDFQYFSFVTLTTTGFGDLTAATAPGRAAVIAEALIGQVFLVTMVARVVSNLGQQIHPSLRAPDGGDRTTPEPGE
ncbi:MAG: potassium channel family protein [Acidimicrobiales bacterium]